MTLQSIRIAVHAEVCSSDVAATEPIGHAVRLVCTRLTGNQIRRGFEGRT